MEIVDPWEEWPFEPRKWQSEALVEVASAVGNRPICRAVMGAGKSVLLAELCRQYDGKIVVTTPKKDLVDQLAKTISTVCRSVGKFYSSAKESKSRVVVCCNASLKTLYLTGDIEDAAWIADECHRTETDQIHEVLESWEPVWRVGVTATPCRGDRSEKISLFEDLVYDYGPWEAIKDGVIVPYRVEHPYPRGESVNGEVIEWVKSQEGPGVIDAISIDDAEDFKDRLESAGVRSAVVHSALADDVQQRRLRALKNGQTQAMIHIDLLTEGVDMPWLRWLVCRRPTGSPIRFAQYVGRGLRSYPGKKVCPVFDPHDLFGELSIDPEAVLGGGEGEEPRTEEEYEIKLDFLLETAKSRARAMGKKLDAAPKNIITPATSWVRRVAESWKIEGLLPMRMPDIERRRDPVSPQQVEMIERCKAGLGGVDMPDQKKRSILMASSAVITRQGLTSSGVDWGTASDLIQIMRVLKRKRRWPTATDSGSEIKGQLEVA